MLNTKVQTATFLPLNLKADQLRISGQERTKVDGPSPPTAGGLKYGCSPQVSMQDQLSTQRNIIVSLSTTPTPVSFQVACYSFL